MTLTIQDGGLEEVTDRRVTWGWCLTFWNVLVICMCPCFILCSLGGLLCNVYAYSDHKIRDFKRSSYKRRWSIGCSVSTFLLGAILVTLFQVFIFVILPKMYDCDVISKLVQLYSGFVTMFSMMQYQAHRGQQMGMSDNGGNYDTSTTTIPSSTISRPAWLG